MFNRLKSFTTLLILFQYVFIVLIFTLPPSLNSQEIVNFKDIKKPIELPFEYHNNFIVLNVRMSGLPMKFIVDTGAEHTIIMKREIPDMLGLEYDRRVRIMGSDLSQEIYALTLNNIALTLANKINITANLVVLEEDFIEIERLTGISIYGIIGSNILRNFVVEFNYQTMIMTLYRNDLFSGPPRGFTTIPIEILRHKPYFTSNITMANGKSVQSRLLIDSGAGISILFYVSERNEIEIPDHYVTGHLGLGLGGILRGYLGRVSVMEMGPYQFNELISNFQDVGEMDSLLIERRKDGLIGNVILSRFTIIIDYQNAEMHIKPNRYFKKRIKYDRSGLILINTGAKLNEVTVLDVIADSPAFKAGIQPDDIITHYQCLPVKFYSFENLNSKFQGRIGKSIRLKVKRNDTSHTFRFKLDRYI